MVSDRQNPQELKGKLIANMKNAVKRTSEQTYLVSSQSGNGNYYDVQLNNENEWHCNCPDFSYRYDLDQSQNKNQIDKCKHIFAVEFSKKLREQVQNELVVIEPVSIKDCIFCKSTYIKKFGIRHNKSGNIQRFICGDCNKTFSINLGFEKMKHNPKAVTLQCNYTSVGSHCAIPKSRFDFSESMYHIKQYGIG